MSTKRWAGIEDLERRFGRMTVAMFLKTFRDSEGLSQTEYAKKLGLSRANLCDLEKGRKLISPERAAKLAMKIGVPEKVLVQCRFKIAYGRRSFLTRSSSKPHPS